MNHLKIHEWQEMELKKDIEEILKAVRRRDFTWMAICCQALLSAAAIIWNYFDGDAISSRGILKVLLVVSIGFPFLLILPAALDYGRMLWKVNRGWRNIKGFVDEFDNRICYWTMMSQEY